MIRLTADSPLSAALDAISEPLACSGVCAPDAPLALVLADDGELVVDLADPDGTVERLLAHAEPAPFGDHERTHFDPAVRRALRLRDRGRVRLRGFDPARHGVLAEVEALLSPRERLVAALTDVQIYPPGGHFVRHRDTPRDGDMLGTLVVLLPLPHSGGDLTIREGDVTRAILRDSSGAASDAPIREVVHVFEDMPEETAGSREVRGGEARTVPGDSREAPPGALRWAAFFADVEHAIDVVRDGHRVVVTYALSRSGAPREPTDDRAAPFREALARELAGRELLPNGGVLLLPCTRRVIVPRGSNAGPALRDLRGLDRELAEAGRALGLEVRVRQCVAASEADAPVDLAAVDLARLREALAEPSLAGLGELVTFAEEGHVLEYLAGGDAVSSLAPLLLARDGDESVLVRARARATLIHEACFSADGYFGNEHYDAWLHALVAVEMVIPSLAARGLVEPEPARRVRHAKFGDGTVVSEQRSDDNLMLVVRFDDGQERRLLRRFLVDL
ncbi:2OG-Fe(II) oxygenase [Nannocystis punicea]|uniref:2OG-Fe(II) oxygenase n=1 Tax=Nannocystis punicea TaxID=2995304 RepID=A0ABY7GWY9_9BACT|nr:2OG-Fe(II) oxygenase [Nannocystis poenicansa]WAS91442.1 2OG-Fe(II) oxygenase [Nannocystis poenicansa]